MIFTMPLEQEVFMVLYGEDQGFNPYNFRLFVENTSALKQGLQAIGKGDIIGDQDWAELARYHHIRRYSNNGQFRTLYHCIGRGMNEALLSPSLYIRTYAELVKNEPKPEEV